MKSIQEDIKNQSWKPVYLLWGEEAYLKQQYKQRLLNGLLPEEDTMNFTRYEGKGLNVGEIIEQADTMPFFAERRVILLEDTGFCKNKCEELADYIKTLPEYLVLIFVESEVDKRSRVYKAIKAAGRIAEFGTQDEKTLVRWVLGLLAKENKKITQRDMEFLLSCTGTDMGNIRMEVQKLLDYTMGRQVITREDVQAICTVQIQNKIFDMVRAVTDRNQKKALELYYDLLSLREPPMRILYLLARQYRQLMLTREMVLEGHGQNEISTRLGIPSFAARNYIQCSRKYELSQLRQAVEDFTEAEEAVKTGRLGDVLSVELMIVKYSSKA